MSRRRLIILAAAVVLIAGAAVAQYTPWLYWTLIPRAQMDEIVGEASGETAWATIADINAYNRARKSEEFAGNFWETQVVVERLKSYGLAGVEIVTFPGGPAWVPVKGDLWEEKPSRRKLASINDMLPMLLYGSTSADVAGDLVWVGRGTPKDITDAAVKDKIVVTEGNVMAVHNEACLRQGALGIVSIAQSRPYFDPLQMPWSGIRFRTPRMPGPAAPAQATPPPQPKFAFQLPVREGDILKRRLLAGEKISARARVESREETADLENVTCAIPGTDAAAGEVILSAHLFEGFQKQGANDNISGSATILEVARILNTCIAEGRLPKPKRTIRFIWGPEFSGIGKWAQANRALMEKTLCNINMDMVGEWLSRNKAFFCLMRTTYGNPHYINDVMENYFRYVGEGNRERIQNRSGAAGVPVRIVAPFGADEPFLYSIETHYGASDHEVFNDWGVGVPGIMMIAWPDQWYHTSGDVADKSDPTQLKRAAAIGAAGAYTIASADADLAGKIAGETASNAARRLGHQLAVGVEALNAATKETLAPAYRDARNFIEAAVLNEKETLATILELAPGRPALAAYVEKLKASVDLGGVAHLSTIQAHMEAAAARLGTRPVAIALSDLEKRAARIVPRPTSKVRENGYAEYRKLIEAVPKAEQAKFPFAAGFGAYGMAPAPGQAAGKEDLFLANPSELQLLVNGRRSVLEIKKMLDAQNTRRSGLQGILNYLQVLKLAGLVEL